MAHNYYNHETCKEIVVEVEEIADIVYVTVMDLRTTMLEEVQEMTTTEEEEEEVDNSI